MSTSAWLRRHRDRPAAAHERRAAIRAVTLLLAAAASALLLTHPPAAQHNDRSGPNSPAGAPRAIAVEPPALSRLARSTADGFLAGYLSYVYGRAPASRVKDATASLARSLQAQRMRVPPGLTALQPRVLRLVAAAAPAGLLGVTAIISDEPPVDYRLALLLKPARGGLLVSAVDGI
jgi:hypothetical protein